MSDRAGAEMCRSTPRLQSPHKEATEILAPDGPPPHPAMNESPRWPDDASRVLKAMVWAHSADGSSARAAAVKVLSYSFYRAVAGSRSPDGGGSQPHHQ